MKQGIFLFLIALVAACSAPKPESTVEELKATRDSLQQVQFDIDKEIAKLDEKIALLDSNLVKEDIKTIKQLTMQKNKLAAISLKINQLENDLIKEEDESSLTPVAIKEMIGELFNHYIIVYGNVEANEYASISPEMGGQIRTIHVDPGERVQKGQLLVSLNTDAVENQIKATKSSLELLTTTYEKQKSLWDQGIGSEIQYLQAKSQKESTEAQLEALEAQKRMEQIRAPFTGYVDKIFQKEGALASAMYPVLDMVDMRKLIIKANISENHIGSVKRGELVEVSFAALPDVVLKSPVKFVSRVIDEDSRTFQIELEIDNKAEKIKPNMVSTIKINDFSAQDALVVPSLVIMKDIKGDYVYTIEKKEAKNITHKVYVSPTLSYENKTLIESGISKGDKVIIKGYHLVSAGVPVRIVQ